MLIQHAIAAAREAGDSILHWYNGSVETQVKEDGSPLTQADLAASEIIRTRLAQTGLPVLCEEAVIDYEVRKDWERFWIVDPLDGTREFLDRTGEFTVNIALVEGGKPVAGVIFAPVFNELAWAEEGKGAFLETGDGTTRLHARGPTERIGVRSRSTADHVQRFFSQNGVEVDKPVGSALKFIRVAQGAAGLYARFSRSKEWDTAAGQIILLESGGWMLDPVNRRPLVYNKADLANTHFVVGCENWDPATLKWPEEG